MINIFTGHSSMQLLGATLDFTASLIALHTSAYAQRGIFFRYLQVLPLGTSRGEVLRRESDASNGREVTTTASFTSLRMVLVPHSREKRGTLRAFQKKEKKGRRTARKKIASPKRHKRVYLRSPRFCLRLARTDCWLFSSCASRLTQISFPAHSEIIFIWVIFRASFFKRNKTDDKLQRRCPPCARAHNIDINVRVT